MRSINRDSFPHLAVCVADISRRWVSTVAAYPMATYWGIKLGAGCRFYGLPILRRHPRSDITIGSCCQFRSAEWSNLAGLNHRCVISTMKEKAILYIGANCGFSGATIATEASVVIGDRVMVGANCFISDTDWHPLAPMQRAAGERGTSKPVTIENDVWLGANVVVLKGVCIGEGSVVAANSVVVQSIPAGVLAAGNPAKPLKPIAAIA